MYSCIWKNILGVLHRFNFWLICPWRGDFPQGTRLSHDLCNGLILWTTIKDGIYIFVAATIRISANVFFSNFNIFAQVQRALTTLWEWKGRLLWTSQSVIRLAYRHDLPESLFYQWSLLYCLCNLLTAEPISIGLNIVNLLENSRALLLTI